MKKKKNSFTQNEFTINRTDRLDVAVAVIVSFRFVSPCWPKRMKALFFCIEMRLCLCVFVFARSNEQLCTRMSWSLSFAVECRIKIDEFVLKCDNRQTHRALKQRQTKRHRNQVEIGWKSWIDEALKYRPHTHANAHTKLNYHKNGIYFDLFVVLTHSRKKKKISQNSPLRLMDNVFYLKISFVFCSTFSVLALRTCWLIARPNDRVHIRRMKKE